MDPQTIVLRHEQIAQKINRIAHELYENFFEADKVILLGVAGQGYLLAERLAARLAHISSLQWELGKITLHKDNPLEREVQLSIPLEALKGQYVVLIDDVLNSGKTLIYAARYVLQAPVKRLSTVCLVDRRHRKFPIRADFVGLTLSTTLQEHIVVQFQSGNDTVYLQ